jgi:hypothetical protein
MITPKMITRLSAPAICLALALLVACSSPQGKGNGVTPTAVPQNATQLQASFDVGNIAPPAADSEHVSVFAKFTTTANKDVRLSDGASITCNGVKLAYMAAGAYNSHYTTAYYTATIPSSATAYHFVYTANGHVTKADVAVPPAPTITSPAANAQIPIGTVTIRFATNAHASALLAFATDSSGDTTSGTLTAATGAQSGAYPLNTGDFPAGKGKITLTALEADAAVTSDFVHTTANIVVTATIAVTWVAA